MPTTPDAGVILAHRWSIQTNRSLVLPGMQLVLTQPRPVPGLSVYPAIAGMLWARFGDGLLAPMPRAEKAAITSANWGELIHAISARRDRAAFIQLFNH